MKVCTINLTLNLLLPHVVLTHVITRSSESTDSFIVKLLHTNTLVCDFENSTQRFRSSTVVDLKHQLYFITRSVICTWSPVVAFERVWKTSNLCTKYYSLECVKTCSRVWIYMFLRSIKTLDLMAEKESEYSDLHKSRLIEMCISISRDKCTYLFLLSWVFNCAKLHFSCFWIFLD